MEGQEESKDLEQKEAEGKTDEWVPQGKRRPDDEFFDMTTIVPLRTEIVNDDGSVEIIVVEEGNGNVIEETDTVYYRHEHRFDNGQLVDLNETRKVADKLVMNDESVHNFLRSSFIRMKRGQVSFIKVGKSQHRDIFHKNNLNMQKTQAEKDHMMAAVGSDIYIRVQITKVKRDPKCDNTATWDQKLIFFDKVRSVGKELCEEE